MLQEDPWNSISAGFCTGAMLNARYGPRQALLNGTRTGFFFVRTLLNSVWVFLLRFIDCSIRNLTYAIFLLFLKAVFEGIGIVLNRQATAGAPAPAPLPPPEMTQSPENALLNSANFAVANGSSASTGTSSFQSEASFLSDTSNSSTSISPSEIESPQPNVSEGSKERSWFGFLGGGNK